MIIRRSNLHLPSCPPASAAVATCRDTKEVVPLHVQVLAYSPSFSSFSLLHLPSCRLPTRSLLGTNNDTTRSTVPTLL